MGVAGETVSVSGTSGGVLGVQTGVSPVGSASVCVFMVLEPSSCWAWLGESMASSFGETVGRGELKKQGCPQRALSRQPPVLMGIPDMLWYGKVLDLGFEPESGGGMVGT